MISTDVILVHITRPVTFSSTYNSAVGQYRSGAVDQIVLQLDLYDIVIR
jgi:hypothetical protein